jgi:hypothetical protein
MLEIHTADDEIQGYPVVCIRVMNPSEEEINEETEARVRREWVAAYDAHPKFWFLVDIRDVTVFGAFSIVPKVVDILKSLRERSRTQVITTGLILTPVADPLVRAVTALYPPERPITTGTTPEDVWVKLMNEPLQ